MAAKKEPTKGVQIAERDWRGKKVFACPCGFTHEDRKTVEVHRALGLCRRKPVAEPEGDED